MEVKMELTQREKEICKYIAKGYNNRQISELMYISTHTVKTCVATLLANTGAKNRTHLAYLLGKDKFIEM